MKKQHKKIKNLNCNPKYTIFSEFDKEKYYNFFFVQKTSKQRCCTLFLSHAILLQVVWNLCIFPGVLCKIYINSLVCCAKSIYSLHVVWNLYIHLYVVQNLYTPCMLCEIYVFPCMLCKIYLFPLHVVRNLNIFSCMLCEISIFPCILCKILVSGILPSLFW